MGQWHDQIFSSTTFDARLVFARCCLSILAHGHIDSTARMQSKQLSLLFQKNKIVQGGKDVKRVLGVFLCLTLIGVTASPAFACRHHRRYSTQARYRRVAYNRGYSQQRNYYAYPAKRSFWQRHRDALTLAIGTGGGAGVGALLGGRRGAGIGALAGFGGSALYTYKLRDRHRRY